MSVGQLAALAGIIGAAGTLVGSVTALIVALRAHTRIDTIQQSQANYPPPPSPGVHP